MSSDYVIPAEVTSPKRQWTLVKVLHDFGEGRAAVAMGLWDEKQVLAMRWNGNDENPIGNPQSRGLPTWFIVPDEFRQAILVQLQELAPENRLLATEYFTDAVVLTNTIPVPAERKQVQDAVLRGIGKRNDYERWTVKIFAPANRLGYLVRVQGPRDFTWERIFEPEEQSADFIERAVREAVN